MCSHNLCTNLTHSGVLSIFVHHVIINSSAICIASNTDELNKHMIISSDGQIKCNVSNKMGEHCIVHHRLQKFQFQV